MLIERMEGTMHKIYEEHYFKYTLKNSSTFISFQYF